MHSVYGVFMCVSLPHDKHGARLVAGLVSAGEAANPFEFSACDVKDVSPSWPAPSFPRLPVGYI